MIECEVVREAMTEEDGTEHAYQKVEQVLRVCCHHVALSHTATLEEGEAELHE